VKKDLKAPVIIGRGMIACNKPDYRSGGTGKRITQRANSLLPATDSYAAMWIEIVNLTFLAGPISALLAWLVSHNAPDPFPAAKRLWKFLGRVSWAMGLSGLLAAGMLVEGYRHPVKPDPETRQIYSYNLHGRIIYLTKEEDSALSFFEVISVVGLFGFFLALYIVQRQQRIADAKSYAQLSS